MDIFVYKMAHSTSSLGTLRTPVVCLPGQALNGTCGPTRVGKRRLAGSAKKEKWGGLQVYTPDLNLPKFTLRPNHCHNHIALAAGAWAVIQVPTHQNHLCRHRRRYRRKQIKMIAVPPVGFSAGGVFRRNTPRIFHNFYNLRMAFDITPPCEIKQCWGSILSESSHNNRD